MLFGGADLFFFRSEYIADFVVWYVSERDYVGKRSGYYGEPVRNGKLKMLGLRIIKLNVLIYCFKSVRRE